MCGTEDEEETRGGMGLKSGEAMGERDWRVEGQGERGAEGEKLEEGERPTWRRRRRVFSGEGVAAAQEGTVACNDGHKRWP